MRRVRRVRRVRGVWRWRRRDEVAVLVLEARWALVGDSEVEGLVGARGAEGAGVPLKRGGRRGGEAARRRVLFAHGGRRARAHRARAPPTCNNKQPSLQLSCILL